MRSNLKLAAYTFAGLLVGWCAWSTPAQEAGAPAGQQMRHGQRGDRLEWLSKELNLTDDQKSQLKPILDDEGKQMRAIHQDTSLTPEQKRDKMKELRESTDPKIEAILTPDQQKKFHEMNQHREHQGKPGSANPPSGS